MIRTILRLALAPQGADGLVDAFRTHQILETSLAQPGCLSAEVAIAVDGSEAIVTATWGDHTAYQRWTSRPDRDHSSAALSPHLAQPLEAETVGQVYRVAHRPVQESAHHH